MHVFRSITRALQIIYDTNINLRTIAYFFQQRKLFHLFESKPTIDLI